jgi:hypothetical protein
MGITSCASRRLSERATVPDDVSWPPQFVRERRLRLRLSRREPCVGEDCVDAPIGIGTLASKSCDPPERPRFSPSSRVRSRMDFRDHDGSTFNCSRYKPVVGDVPAAQITHIDWKIPKIWCLRAYYRMSRLSQSFSESND